MGYHPPSPISNDGWEYHQENTHSEHSNSWRFASEKQDEQENHMGYFLPPQNDASHDSNGGWEGNSNVPYDIHPKISSLDHASTESLFQNSPPTQTSMNQSLSKLETMFEKYEREAQISWNEQENLFKNMEIMLAQVVSATRKEEGQDEEASVSSKISMKKEVVEIFEPETALEMTREPEHSQPPQTPLDQRCSTLIEKYEEEMKKAWEDQQTSSMKELLKQMLSVKEEVEEQASEEDTQEKSNSSEAEKYIQEKLMEPPMQKALDEYKTPIITQQTSLEFKEVKATNKSTNSVPNPASKINQAICKRKLAEERPRQGTVAESSPHLRSFLLTNWKKRKKVKNNMSS
ncbi:uncharacterized protein DS421_5g143170 [Arachis hypogaea]|nr:uncharacterized protein DS421_5g143170 [Arachis hypogaea]